MKLLAAVTMGALLAGSSASALTVITTWTGVIGPPNDPGTQEGIDVAGIFGHAGGALTGEAFKAVFTTNWSVPGSSVTVAPGVGSVVSGGGFEPVVATGVFTLGGVKLILSGANYSESARVVLPVSNIYDVSQDEHSQIVIQIYSDVMNFITSYRASHDFSYTAGPGDMGTGSLYTCGNDPALCSNLPLHTETVTSMAVSAAPEPATWAIMLTGLFGVGVMRRRQLKASM